MAIFPSDDLALDSATRRRIRPLINGHKSNGRENVKRNPPTNGTAQNRDVWGKKKFVGDAPFSLMIADVELVMSFWRKYGAAGFTLYDFEKRQVGPPGYDDAVLLGNATGALQTFTLPAKEVSGLVLYKNGVAIPAGSITLHNGAAPLYDGPGAEGQATVDLAAGAATAGQAITAAFLGRYRYNPVEILQEPDKSTAEWNLQLVLVRFSEM